MKQQLTVNSLAKATGVSGETVRHYEEIGLLPKAERGLNGYRIFPTSASPRMWFILRAKNLGFGLAEIATLLDLSDRRQTDSQTDMARLQEAAAAKMSEIEDRIRDLEQIRAGLLRLVESCPGAGRLADCPILNALSGVPEPSNRGGTNSCQACPTA